MCETEGFRPRWMLRKEIKNCPEGTRAYILYTEEDNTEADLTEINLTPRLIRPPRNDVTLM